ncbi:phosphatidylglycerol/phosphatidylinositol transfer protein-like [Plakobranchus ocellatus]|uniref:Phosphatidylglycerol/phosphatidylinositol transfer protein-like n=1 Tax=Plakobranchus ocellatus TaxID=259542 RepID=A0AAV4C128_9GAST|nr:phosphatidylglycerol/phosphatidylinositol transfer protein-like [Plakobranchus ocellatus]
MASESKLQSVIMMYKGRLIKVGILVFFSLLLMVLYVNFFQHPPANELLRNNRKAMLSSEKHDFGASLFLNHEEETSDNDDLSFDEKDDNESNKDDNEDSDRDADIELEDDKENERESMETDNEKSHDDDTGSDAEKSDEKAQRDDVLSHKKRDLGSSNEIEMSGHWSQFLKQKNLVPIGAVYSKCEHTVDGGKFNIESRYNGRALYDNYWDLCDVEDDLPDEEKTFVCPLSPGLYSRVKDKAIPGYLPKVSKVNQEVS